MRIGLFGRLILTLTLLWVHLPAKGQKFQAPTSEELQMTSDPKAPGAPAVYLFREETMDNSSHVQSTYARIKVLTEFGKEWATVEVPYEPELEALPKIEGRTIHADGTVIPLIGKPADLLIVKTHGLNLRTATFTLPSAEVGSILEYRWTKPLQKARGEGGTADSFWGSEHAGGSPDWSVQQELFVHKAHFFYNSLNRFGDAMGGRVIDEYPPRWTTMWLTGYLMYKERLPAGAHVVPSVSKTYTLDINDVPHISHEDDSIPLDSLRYRVWFYLTPETSPGLFWSAARQRWLKT